MEFMRKKRRRAMGAGVRAFIVARKPGNAGGAKRSLPTATMALWWADFASPPYKSYHFRRDMTVVQYLYCFAEVQVGEVP